MTTPAVKTDKAAPDLTAAIYALLSLPGIGPKKARDIWNKSEIGGIGFYRVLEDEAYARHILGRDRVSPFYSAVEKSISEIELAASHGFSFLHLDDPRYPRKLKHRLDDKAPLVLTVRGNVSLIDSDGISFCGSRKVSDRGRRAADLCSSMLWDYEYNVISGYAKGVDEVTHRAALASGGTTTIVLPEGCKGFRIKKSLEDVWDWERILVISEFAPSARWTTGRAMQRNSTICSLGDAMILIEARPKGGSYQAGLECLRLKIDLYAINFETVHEENRGNQELITGHGAIPIGVDDELAGTPDVMDIVLMNLMENVPAIRNIEAKDQLSLFASK